MIAKRDDVKEHIHLTPDFDGFAKSHPWIGPKAGDVQSLPGGGYLQQFQNASVYGPVDGDPHEVHGAIRDKYLQLGGPAGFLGLPVSDETAKSDGQGSFSQFQNGVIHSHPKIGTFEVHGAILVEWSALGWDATTYPLTDETGTADGVGRFNHFRTFLPDGTTSDSSIYWTPDLGAHEVHGAIHVAWSGIGSETSFLGYPTSDEHDSGDGRQSDFQNGSIFWDAAGGAQIRPQWFAIDRPSITFGSGISAGGSGRLTIFSDGTTHFQGHLHDSGFPSYDCLAVFTVKDADGRAYAASHSGRVHGTDEPGSRDLDWDDWGTSDDVRKNWSRIRLGATGGSQISVTSDWSPQKIAEDVVAVLGIVLAILPLLFDGGSSKKSNDPNYGRPDDFPDGGEPPPDGAVGPKI